jgi:hypothetical protein
MRLQPDPVHGETRRVIVLDGQRVDRDAIVDFADLDRPGLTYRVVVYANQARGGLAVGDQCQICFQGPRRYRTISDPAKWVFVERTDPAHVDFDAEVEAMTLTVVS